MRKVKLCTSCKMVTEPELRFLRCTLPKEHEESHTDGEITWE